MIIKRKIQYKTPFRYNRMDLLICLDNMYPELPPHYKTNYPFADREGVVRVRI